MSMEASGGGASVGTSDRSGGNNVGDECRIGIESSDENDESSDLRFSEEEKEQFVSFEKALDTKGPPADAKPKIQKVLSKLRYNDTLKKYFEPKMFSFGRHPDRTLEMAKQIKVNLAAEFLKQNDVKKEYLYADIKKQIKELKDCYYDVLTYCSDEDHRLAWVFLVDGCAILQFMYISVDLGANPDTQFRDLRIKTDYAEFLEHDMFLLENQLPYRLLQLIIRRASKHQKTKEDQEQSTSSKEDKRASKRKELLESIYKFIFYRFRSPFEWYNNKNKILEGLEDDHVHLLDLLRKKLIQPLHQKDHEKHDLIQLKYHEKLMSIIGRTVGLFDKLKYYNCNEIDRYRVPVPFRNIGKLREAGIKLKHSKTSCVGDFSFSDGMLKLPRIIVKESTVRMFLNMLGYEMCPDFHNESEVSTYMYFLDKLIDQTQDVDELREKNILGNQIGSDEEVVKLFNEISTHLFPNSKYYEVKRNIDNYFDNKGLMWLHKVSHDIHQYFKRRWSLLAFIGALLAIVSGIIQTIITVLAYQPDSKKGN
ncbi:hypothetical protein EZV62_005202 [Acer yangbiense]|uniref:Uncharacterized protein n=1 Tax=Acer yangbiense TaxID=1000413 RepID=A0A5C7ILI0_9ROSI|nr:hypothetical protein EZV62_005202 [Acer yangbiense]